ncbi:Alpha-actinin A [Cucumispora dikerogammari]|nr:Alpha-actinin A [Cucumispora dikerogammari]
MSANNKLNDSTDNNKDLFITDDKPVVTPDTKSVPITIEEPLPMSEPDNNKIDYSNEVQKRAFTKWFNSKLKHTNNPPIENIFTDLVDGVSLNYVLQYISNTVYHFTIDPTKEIIKRENLQIFFTECKELGMPLINCGAEDIIQQNEKIILGLIFTLITESQYFQSGMDRDKSINNEILNWVRAVAADYNIIPSSVSNFSTDWKDGKLFNCILDKYDPIHCGDYADCLNMTNEANLTKAFNNAEEFHGIPRLLEVEDLTEVMIPDSKSVFAYVSEYYNKFSHQKINNSGINTSFGDKTIWLKNQENDYDRYVKRFQGEMDYIKKINDELLRDMLKIEEKIKLQLVAKRLAEASLYKLTNVYSNINTILEMSDMPQLEKEKTPEVIKRQFLEPMESYTISLDKFSKTVKDSEKNKNNRVEITCNLLSKTDDLKSQTGDILKVLKSPENDPQKRGLERKLSFLEDIQKAKLDIENKLKKAMNKFKAVDVKKIGLIKHSDYCSLANLIGFEPTLQQERVSKEEFIKEVEVNLNFLDIKFENLKLTISQE